MTGVRLNTPEVSKLAWEELDEESLIIFLHCPRQHVVRLQAYFEIHEGIGIVRTLDLKNSLLCIITTKSMAPDAFRLLEALKPEIEWSRAEPPIECTKEQYLGYQRKGRRSSGSV